MTHIHGACPLDCPDTCSWVVTVEDGRAVALRGDRGHPYTRGALCASVSRGVAIIVSVRTVKNADTDRSVTGPSGLGHIGRTFFVSGLKSGVLMNGRARTPRELFRNCGNRT